MYKAKFNVQRFTTDVTQNQGKYKNILINNLHMQKLDPIIDVAVKVKHPDLD